MGRIQKLRRICRLPKISRFDPEGKNGEKCVTLAVDEYESIRLIDKEGLSQEECSKRMKVARTTVQMIYATAREKIATAIVEGLSLKIEGGAYCLCDGCESFSVCSACKKHSKC